MRIFQLIFILILITAGCQTIETPEPIVQVPAFYASAMTSFGDLNMRADGELFVAKSDYTVDSFGVYEFEGALQATDCSSTDCGPQLRLIWRDKQQNTANLDGLELGDQEYRFLEAGDSIVKYNITLTAQADSSAESISWLVNGELSGTGEKFTFEWTKPDVMAIPITVEATYASGCGNQLDDTLYLPNHGCDVEIYFTKLSETRYVYEAAATGGKGLSYRWQFTNGITASSRLVEYDYNSLPSGGIEDVTLRVSGAECSAQDRKLVRIGTASSGCTINYTEEITPIIINTQPSIGLDYSELTLEYIDEQGNFYSTVKAEQPTWGSFVVSSIADYRDPYFQPAQRSKKVIATFNCVMTGEAGSIEFRDGSLSLPVGFGL